MNRREFLRKTFRAAGIAGLYGLGAGALEDARALGIFPVQMASGSAGNCVAGNTSQTTLLIHSNTVNGSTTFSDSGKAATCPHVITVNGNVRHTTDYVFPGFGSTSIYFPGGADFLSLADSTAWDLGAGDFCVQFWWNFGGSVDNNCGFIGRYIGEPATWGLVWQPNNLDWYYDNGTRVQFAWVPVSNTPYHIALSRVAGTLRAFVNGSQIGGNQVDPVNYNTNKPLAIGSYVSGGGGSYATGYMQEISITVGSGVYPPGGFTPNAYPYCD